MKWYILRYCSILLFILSYYFLPSNAQSVEKYRRDTRETSKHERYSYPEEEIENDSEDCFSSELYSEINLPDEPSKEAEKREISSPGDTLRKLSSPIKNSGKEMKAVTNQEEQKHSWGFRLIFPGTKWCGVDNIADSDDDLGTEEETDKCCRAHDNCEDFMHGGETKYNLTNKSKFVSLSCECDEKLYECLKRANTTTSNRVGKLYFNILARQCFSFMGYPKKCKKSINLLKICSEFVTDTVEKVYQWLPAKKF